MKRLAYASLLLGAFMAVPAHAFEHKTTIEHPEVGSILADYRGSTTIVLKQVGSAASAGRATTLRCQWSVSLTVERSAIADAGFRASRSMTADNALTGSAPGWCSSDSKAIQTIVASQRDRLREKMLAMVAQDRAVILAETTRAKDRGDIG